MTKSKLALSPLTIGLVAIAGMALGVVLAFFPFKEGTVNIENIRVHQETVTSIMLEEKSLSITTLDSTLVFIHYEDILGVARRNGYTRVPDKSNVDDALLPARAHVEEYPVHMPGHHDILVSVQKSRYGYVIGFYHEPETNEMGEWGLSIEVSDLGFGYVKS